MSVEKPDDAGQPDPSVSAPCPLTKRSRGGVVVPIVFVLATVLTIAYYADCWESVPKFIAAFHPNVPTKFIDFENHFYPTGKDLLATGRPAEGFFYSAFAAILFIPWGWLPLNTAIWCWGGMQILATLALFVLSAAFSSKATSRTIAISTFLCILSVPILENFAWGQISVLITLVILASLYARQRGHSVAAGILLALGAAVKYYPAIFVLCFLLKRDVRAITAFVIAAFVFLVVVPAAVMGIDAYVEFNQLASSHLMGASLFSRYTMSQYFAHVFSRVTALLFRSLPPNDLQSLATAGKFLGFLIAFDNLILIWTIRKKALMYKEALSAAVLYLSLTFLISSSWVHYFVYLPFCQMVIFAELWPLFRIRRAWAVAAAALNLCSIALASSFAFNACPDRKFYTTYGFILIANMLSLLAVYILVAISKNETAASEKSSTAAIPTDGATRVLAETSAETS